MWYWVRCAIGTIAIRAGKTNFAASIVESILRSHPEDVAALLYFAWLLQQLGRFEQSVEYCRRLAAKNAVNSDVWAGLGYSLQELGRDEEAIAAFQTALHHDPENRLVNCNMAHSLRRCGRLQDALPSSRRAVNLNPNEASAIQPGHHVIRTSTIRRRRTSPPTGSGCGTRFNRCVDSTGAREDASGPTRRRVVAASACRQAGS